MLWHNISLRQVIAELKVDTNCGLTSEQVNIRQQMYGKNKLEQKKEKSLFRRFFEQLSDYMVIILLVAAVVSFVTSIMQGEADFVDPIIILIIVVLNATIGVFQENKAEKALEALKKMSSPTAKVKRNGEILTVSSEDLVVGDIIILKTGDFVPADCRLIEAINLRTDEAALTGESFDVDKDATAIMGEDAQMGDRKNMVWATTAINYGRGVAIVVETGMNTGVGRIAEMIISDGTMHTPLQKKLAKTGETLGTAALLICAIIFAMGILKKMPPFDMLMTSVSLAVAAIPEGLPAIVTIMLAIGVQKMAKKNAIIRKLPAVETLGSASVICSDKTGTLTQNKMTVVDIFGENDFVVSLATLCNNDSDATERALIVAAEKIGKNKNRLDKEFPRISEIPFDSNRKLMTTVHKIGNKYRIITKGAPDILLENCVISRDTKASIIRQNNLMAEKALRVLAVAYSDVTVVPKNPEQNLVFAGLIGMIDPPRPEVKEAVKICKNAGIKPVMITGDHIATAVAIASEIGIMSGNDKAMTGAELSKTSEELLQKNIFNYSVFARVTPEHKVRIVKAFQSRGAVVAMTGDGVNDAPALKEADIGCAMGISGTDVAKGAADMVLTDDNFATIVEAVREGRGIYGNIRKAIHFLLSSNIGEILTIFTAIFMGWQAPLLAIQLLWVNLVTDSLPAIALGVDGVDENIMFKKPINKKKGLFADGLALTIVLEGIMIGVLSLIAFSIGNNKFGDLAIGRTMAFAVLSLSQLVHSFNMRSEDSLFKIGIFSNIYLVGAFLVCGLLQVMVISIPALASIFKVVPLDMSQWSVVAMLSILPLIIVEAQKWAEKVDNKVTETDKFNIKRKLV